MPNAENWSYTLLTSLGWIDPLVIFYDPMVEEIRQICSGEASECDYGTRRRIEHAAFFGRNDVTMTLPCMEEHAFYTILVAVGFSAAQNLVQRLKPAGKKKLIPNNTANARSSKASAVSLKVLGWANTRENIASATALPLFHKGEGSSPSKGSFPKCLLHHPP